MPIFLHRTTKRLLESQDPNALPESVSNYIQGPDLSGVSGDTKYWIITGDVVTQMNQSQMDVVDAAELAAQRQASADELDIVDNDLRKFMLMVLDEFNNHADKHNAILAAAATATSLATFKSAMAAVGNYPQRTPAQLKSVFFSKSGQ